MNGRWTLGLFSSEAMDKGNGQWPARYERLECGVLRVMPVKVGVSDVAVTLGQHQESTSHVEVQRVVREEAEGLIKN